MVTITTVLRYKTIRSDKWPQIREIEDLCTSKVKRRIGTLIKIPYFTLTFDIDIEDPVFKYELRNQKRKRLYNNL